MSTPIAFIDLQAQRRRIAAEIDRAVLEVVASGAYILGPQVKQLEEELAAFAGVKHCIACANGTDALLLVLKAWGLGPKDAVFVPAFTFAATGEVVALQGAVPVFVDIDPVTFNMDAASLEAAIGHAKAQGLTPAAVMPVDLFGQPAEYRTLLPLAERHGLKVLVDTAQGFGCTLDGTMTAAMGHAAATSFFPAKPLGCYGDGGAIFTNDTALDTLLRSYRVHGQGADRYEHPRVGINSRLDTIQAAILIEKLKIFPSEIEMRERVAQRYNALFACSNVLRTPQIIAGAQSTWAQYTLIVEDRPRLQEALKAEGVPTMVYYPIPLSQQDAYRHYPVAPGGTPVSDRLAKHVMSLPMHPYLDEATQDRIAAAVLKAAG